MQITTSPAAHFEPGAERCFLAEVTRQLQVVDTRVAGHIGRHELRRTIGAAIIDDDDFPGGTDLIQQFGHFREQQEQAVMLVQCRDNTTDARPFGSGKNRAEAGGAHLKS
jgi:hypothetical protein